MKVSKKDNPFNVQVGQKWRSKDPRRERKFTVMQLEKCQNGFFAAVDYGDYSSMISLERFGRYERCK